MTLSPENISTRIGVDYDRCHRIGDQRGKTDRIWDANVWEIVEKTVSSYGTAYDDLPSAMDRLLARIEGHGDEFAALAAGDSGVMSVVIESNGYPGMGLSAALLMRIARLNVSMDFDLYCERVSERVHANVD